MSLTCKLVGNGEFQVPTLDLLNPNSVLTGCAHALKFEKYHTKRLVRIDLFRTRGIISGGEDCGQEKQQLLKNKTKPTQNRNKGLLHLAFWRMERRNRK